MQVTANGKTFEFPDGTSTDDVGTAIDEYFAGQAAPQAQAQQQDLGWLYSQGIVPETALGVVEAGRGAAQAAVKTINIIPEVADMVSSAGAWAGEKLGIGDGTYNPSPRLSIPEAMQPQTEGGKVVSEILPFLVNPGIAAAPAAASKLTKAANFAKRMVGENTVGVLAQNSDKPADIGEVTKDLGVASVISAGFRGVTKGASKAYQGFKGASAKAESNAAEALAKADDAEAQRMLGSLSPEQQAAVRQRMDELGRDSINTGMRDLASQSRSAVRSDLQQLAGNVNPDQRVIQAAQDVGFPIDLAPAAWTSKNRPYVEFERALKSLPGSKLAEQDRIALGALNKTADDFITNLKGNPDLSVVSQSVADSMNATREKMAVATRGLYKKVDAKIPAATEVDAAPVIDFVKDRLKGLGGERSLLNPGERKILATLSPRQIKDSTGAVVGTKGPTYAALDQTRKDIGQAKRSATGPFAGADSALLGQLEGRLLEAQRGAVQKTAPDMLGVFDAARASTRARKELEDNIVKLYGRNKDGDIVNNMRTSINMLANGSTSNFNRLMKNVPADMRQYVAASALSKALTGKGTTPGVAIDPTQYANWYRGMMRNSQSRKALAQNIPPGGMKALRDMYVFNDGISKALKSDIQTGKIISIKDAFDEASQLGDAIVNRTAKSVLGKVPFVGEPIGNMVAAANSTSKRMEIATDMISSPEFRNLARQQAVWNNASARQVKIAEAALKKSDRYKRWTSTLEPLERKQIYTNGIVNFLKAKEQAKASGE
ncbi:hypothetical protein [Serratia sp. 14-2641]|uniref:hypothetical protein n=1 Tax=Serratia sp. 14-2641 TaxID=1841657 RepID=UPI00080FEEFD|nr:hypothetical protein [Serratia sp. 14-2641]OCJ30578.1 hypothetical protein A6U95_06665 [Serratia sp. 14-2641]